MLNRDKKPFGKEWPDRARSNPPEAVVAWPDSSALSTGILCDGLIALDIDIDDPAIVETVTSAAWHFLGGAPKRIRGNSSRCLLLYGADAGEPSKRSLSGTHGKVEALGKGLQFVAFGEHPSGAAYEWPQGAPDSFHRDKLTPVSADALTAFLSAIAPHIGAEQPTPAPARPESPGLPIVPPLLPTERDAAYAQKALDAEVAKLSGLSDGRNEELNKAAHSLGTLVGNGSIEATTVAHALLEASEANGHVSKHGELQTKRTIESGLNKGMAKPRPTVAQTVGPAIDLSGLAAPKEASKPAPSGKRSVALLQGSQITEQPVTWMGEGFLPLGKLTLLAGAGGTGKSTLAFNIAATITTAGAWPDGSRCATPGNVLIWSSEDDAADTIKPRLMAVGADPNRYAVIAGTIDENGAKDVFDAARDMGALREAVDQMGGVSLLIIDPIVSAVTGDMHKANEVRRSLQAIIDFAAECNCAVLGITHFAKGSQGKNSAERVIGSQAFAALARMVLVAAKEEESDKRVFTRAKANYAPDTGGFSYSIEPVTVHGGIQTIRVVWGEALKGSATSILANVEGDGTDDRSQLGAAKRFLLESLAHGPVPSKELREHAREGLNVSIDTLRRAQKDLGIVARKVGLGGWLWELPLAGLQAQAKATLPIFGR